MLKSERNAFHEALVAAEFNVASLEWSAADPADYYAKSILQSDGIRIHLPGSELWFVFFKARLAPGEKIPRFACKWSEYDYTAEAFVVKPWADAEDCVSKMDDQPRVNHIRLIPIEAACAALTAWAQQVLPPFVLEQSTPDLWAENSVTAPLATVPQLVDDTHFSSDDQARALDVVEQLRAHITASYDLTPEQSDAVNFRLDALASAVTRLGRGTWLTLAIGTVVSIASTLFLSNEQGRRLLEFTGNVLRELARYYLR